MAVSELAWHFSFLYEVKSQRYNFCATALTVFLMEKKNNYVCRFPVSCVPECVWPYYRFYNHLRRSYFVAPSDVFLGLFWCDVVDAPSSDVFLRVCCVCLSVSAWRQCSCRFVLTSSSLTVWSTSMQLSFRPNVFVSDGVIDVEAAVV